MFGPEYHLAQRHDMYHPAHNFASISLTIPSLQYSKKGEENELDPVTWYRRQRRLAAGGYRRVSPRKFLSPIESGNHLATLQPAHTVT